MATATGSPMTYIRLTAVAIVLTLLSSLGGILTLAASPHTAQASLTAPRTPSPLPDTYRDEQRSLRASRSRLYVAPTPSMSARPVHPPRFRPQAVDRAVETGPLHDITMYCSGYRTASGKRPEPGMVATLRRDIPFGTVIHIDGLGDFVVEDRIGHGSEFDLFTHSCADANAFGRRHLRVSFR